MAGRLLRLLVFAAACALVLPAEDLPHVSDCNFCYKCFRTMEERVGSAGARLLLADEAPADLHARKLLQGSDSLGQDPPYQHMGPEKKDISAKQAKRNCTECYGCTTELKVLQGVQAFGQKFNVEQGASPEWLFKADLTGARPELVRALSSAGSSGAAPAEAIVKVWCVPIDKVRRSFSWVCANLEMGQRANQFLLAQQRVLEECGLMDVTVKLHVAPVNAIVPEFGFHIWWNGLWMEKAPGISLNQLSYITRKLFVTNTIKELLQVKLNRTQVVRAAMLDLLTSQCDRHAQNVFISEDGNIKLIDNLNALKFGWLWCGSDSILLPGTNKNEIVRFGGDLVGKRQNARARRSINPMLLLDYRCYVEGGKIGTKYPPEVKQCLASLSQMTPKEIQAKYDFPLLRNAELLHVRAKDMYEKGFEWALQRGEPLNLKERRYKWHQPCCTIQVDDHNKVSCGHPWNVTPEFPKGNPLKGGPWTNSWPDPGTFEGGTRFED